MKILSNWRFLPPWWAWVLVLMGTAAAAALGLWQLSRAEAKRQLLADYRVATTQAPTPLDARLPGAERPRPVTVRGKYLADRQLLLDNQAHQERPGYHLWTPLRLTGGGLILVNRGWIEQFPRRDQAAALPAPVGSVELQGLWRALPQPGLRSNAGGCKKAESFPQFVVYPQAGELACLLGEPVADGVLLLDAGAGGGYVRDWSFSETIPPQRHIGYAVQWFAIALTILLLFIKINLKRVQLP